MFKLFRKRRERSIAVIEEEPCIHHWIYETPHGPTSVGICLNCGSSHTAPNSLPFQVDSFHFLSPSAKEKVIKANKKKYKDHLADRFPESLE